MLWLLGGGCFLLTWLGARMLRTYASALGMIDIPNFRSSHKEPTPRGGGSAIVIIVLSAMCAWSLWMNGDIRLCMAVIPSGGLVAAVGFWDDRYSLSARFRFAVHLLAAAWAVWQLGGWNFVDLGFVRLQLGGVGFALKVVGLVWAINLYNFMDGIDGLAGSEGVFLGGAGAVLMWLAGADPGPHIFLALACAGFLILNWPPAKIFMGDVGSGFLGLSFGVLSLYGESKTGSLIPWLILPSVFVVDATFTLFRRALRGVRITDAHRTHAYQWAARKWGSHKKVTLWVLVINVVVLIPAALVAKVPGAFGGVALLLVWFFLSWLVWAMNAGVPEVGSEN